MSRNSKDAPTAVSPSDQWNDSPSHYNGLPLSVVLIDPATDQYVEVDQSLCARLRYLPNELLHAPVPQTHPDLSPEVLRELNRQLQARGSNVKFYTRQRCSDGELLDAFVTSTLTARDGRSLLQLVTVDVTARTRAEQALQEVEKRFRATFEQSAVGIAHIALNGTFLRVNKKYRQTLGYSETELRHLTMVNISHPNDLDLDWAQSNALMQGESATYSVEKRLLRNGGGVIWVNLTMSLLRDQNGDPEYLISVIEDITARKRAESERDELLRNLEHQVTQRTAELERLSMTDALTGIANRRHFDKSLATEWARAVRSHRPMSLVLLDIDDFKLLNDSFGHVQGDAILKMVAGFVQQVACRSSDLGARYGGDEFAMLLPETDISGAQRLAEKLRELLSNVSLVDGHPGQFRITLSQGIAGAKATREKSATDLLLAADRALYVAKEKGRAQIEIVSEL
jgi:diguanylate cyclase (GGDEF)-like protein/PAS domain S-box-containing protein